MEMDLKTIIDKIKQEGVSEAEKQAGDMIEAARKKADGIIAEASKKAEDKTRQASKDAQNFQKSSEEALKQAARDTLLGLKEDIVKLFDNVLKRGTAAALSAQPVNEAVIALINNFRKGSNADIEVLTSEAQRDALEKAVLSALKGEMAKGLTVKASRNIDSGFRIGVKGENYYYDFTDEAVAEAFKAYLNPRLSEILDGGPAGGK